MAILKLTPSCQDYLWGGSRLRTDFGIKSDLEPLAEAWVLSCHPDGPSYLPDGTTLADYAAAHPEALGTDCAKFEQFPILTKFIDASSNLSIQVHPSNDYALKNEHQYGKSEMWYVLDCVPGAYLYYGFTHEISKEEFAERIKNNTLTEVLNAVPVHKGDCFFIPSGTLHAICQGIVVVEVQQNSNVTYRVYDYGRVGADGKPRQLHIPQALDVTERKPPVAHDFHGHLAQCDYLRWMPWRAASRISAMMFLYFSADPGRRGDPDRDRHRREPAHPQGAEPVPARWHRGLRRNRHRPQVPAYPGVNKA